MRSSASRASATPRCASCAPTKNRFGSTDEVGVFEMAETGLLEVADPARAFLADHRRAAPRQHRRADAGGQPADARRGPGPGQPDRLRHADAQGERPRPEPAEPADRGARAAGRRSPSAATTSTPTWPAGCRSPSRASTCRSPWPWPRRCATGRSRPGPSRSARSACSASCAASSASSAGCARRPGSGSSGAIVPRAVGGPTSRRIDGLDVVHGRDARARRSRPRWPIAPRPRGEAVPAMLG